MILIHGLPVPMLKQHYDRVEKEESHSYYGFQKAKRKDGAKEGETTFHMASSMAHLC